MKKLIPKLQNGQSSTYVAKQKLIPVIPYKLKDNERWINGQIVQLKDEQVDNQSNEPQVLKEEREKQLSSKETEKERQKELKKGLENFGGFINLTTRLLPSQIAGAVKEGQNFGDYIANGNKGIGRNVLLNTAFDLGTGVGIKLFPKMYEYALDQTIGDFNLSYLLNKNKQFNTNKIGDLIGQGGESKVYKDLTNANRVIKETRPIKNSYYKTYTKSRVRRNINPYYLKERIEGFKDNADGTKTLYVSQRKINPNIIIDDKDIKDPIKLQDELMKKKGFKRLSVKEITELPEANVLIGRVNSLPAYWQMKGTFFDRNVPSVFSNGKWYIPDAKIGKDKNVQFIKRTLFPQSKELNSFQKYIDNLFFKNNPITLQNIDNDAVLLQGKNKGIFPLLSKEYNTGIVEEKLDDNFAKQLRLQFIIQNE